MHQDVEVEVWPCEFLIKPLLRLLGLQVAFVVLLCACMREGASAAGLCRAALAAGTPAASLLWFQGGSAAEFLACASMGSSAWVYSVWGL